MNFEFASHVFQEHESYVAYTLQNFISDCGGLIAMGFSLLSIFEIVLRFIETIAVRRNRVGAGQSEN
jgi:NhaP-type Na+/H+ or K+/H+ antiporter